MNLLNAALLGGIEISIVSIGNTSLSLIRGIAGVL